MSSTETQWMIGHNSRSGLYEVHAVGCMHVNHPAFSNGFSTRQAPTAAQAAADFQAWNEGCITKLGPCAKKA